MSSIIPKEQLAQYQRWQFDSFDGNSPSQPAPPPPPAQALPGDDSLAPAEPGEAAFHLPTAEEIEQLHEQARQEGYQAGFEEGRQAAEAAAAPLREAEMARLSALVDSLGNALKAMDQEVAEQLLDLSLEVASQVIRSTVKIRRELLLPVIREALQALPLHHGSIAVHLNPDDAAALQDALGEMASHNNLTIRPDSSLATGSCLVKAGHSEVDATLETRWKRVLEAIGVDPEAWQTP